MMAAQLPKDFEIIEGLVEVRVYMDTDFIMLDVDTADNAPAMHLQGDIDNYLKSILDAGNGVLWTDDKNIVKLMGVKW